VKAIKLYRSRIHAVDMANMCVADYLAVLNNSTKDDPDVKAIQLHLDRGYTVMIYLRTFTEIAEFPTIDLLNPTGVLLSSVAREVNTALIPCKLSRVLFVPEKHLLYEITSGCGQKHYQHTYTIFEKLVDIL